MGTEEQARGTAERPTGPVWQHVQRYECYLWGVVVAASLADLALTEYGLERGFVEGNPLPAMALDAFGFAGLLLLKALLVLAGGVVWALAPERYSVVIPLGIALPSTAAVAINAVLLATV